MESLGHFIFELLKIAVLAYIYSSILYFIYNHIPKNKKPVWVEKWLKSKKILWLSISILLLLYMFTPFGNHGLGDSARIPISFTKEISNINWTKYGKLNGIKTSDENEIELTHFKIKNNTLCGNLSSNFYDFENNYFIYDIDSDKITEFENENDYNNFAQKNKLPKSSELKSFEENYRDYWSGWRLFLLP
ncbi:hypothetical protein [uncultured Flavobacterium sp.]|jgi:hypothetical protein|uniref:hypothetical protein n=1 Tax=uncultured Flavobacterium sp. TaxID=165435 RepID=UPI0030EF4C67